MQNVYRKFKVWGLLLFLMLFAAGVTGYRTTTEVQAAARGFTTINGKTYYIDSNGSKHKGWLTLNGKKYYFNTKSGVMRTGWVTNSKGQKRYFNTKTGVMKTGWSKTSSGKKRYFSPKTGIMREGLLTISGKMYYFNAKTGYMAKGVFVKSKNNKLRYFKSNGAMATGWVSNSKKEKRYFQPSTGYMLTGFQKISGKTYYFYSDTGKMATGWVENKSTGAKYYFDPSTGVMATGTKTIGSTTYQFASDGVLTGTASTSPEITASTGTRTIKNYLAGALQPVGQALYVWGGGWNDSTRKGVSPKWKIWYDSKDSSYNYTKYNDLSALNRSRGLDCSGFVGWSAYQVMQTKSGVGSGYTVVSGEIGSYYKSLGWGTIINQSSLKKKNYVLKPGDVGYNDGHTWIVIGQCSDKSVVIVHSTPQAGCQISGTTTPSGSYSSEAAALAAKYMSKYSGYTKYTYHPSCGNYIRNGNYLRWNSSTLSDPDGYLNMTADQILADLFK